jgi:hypothetical protein
MNGLLISKIKIKPDAVIIVSVEASL